MEEIMLQTQWGWPIALYLFLGGLGAGTLLVSALIDLKLKALKRTAFAAAVAGVACLGLGTCLLLLDVTMPLRALMLWRSFSHLGSWMAIGAWLLSVGIVVGLVWALSCGTGKLAGIAAKLERAHKPLGIAVCALGVCIAAYTGILLSVLAAHPLWNTPLLPVLFLVSAVDTGVALVVILSGVLDKGDGALHGIHMMLERCTLILVAVEAVVLVALLALVGSGSETGAASVAILTTGALAVPFWLLFAAVGLAIPAAVAFASLKGAKKGEPAVETSAEAVEGEASEPARKIPLGLIGAACCLVGGCALRFLVLMAGIPVWM